MRANLLKIWDDLQGSYWFIPTLMVIGAFFLSLLATEIDSRLGAEWIRNLDFLYFSHAEGARAVLSTIAGSMIGVAGVTFSMTIVSVSFAGAQFGPRLIGNFMRDRGNQITLGTFIATFVYCLFILRTVREAGEGADALAYVPHVSLLVALFLTMASVGVLIFFIHHIPESLNVSNLMAKVGRDLIDHIELIFPEDTGEQAPNSLAAEVDFDAVYGNHAASVTGEKSGYIQTYDEHTAMTIAQENDICIRMEFRPGDFAAVGDVLMRVWPEDRISDDIMDSLRNCFAFGKHRTSHQNLLFMVDELVEIAARALSPGVNDPFTAMECLNWLGAATRAFACRVPAQSHRFNEEGKLRVIANPVSFERFTDAAFGQLSQYVAADRNVGLYALRTMAMIMTVMKDRDYRLIIARHAQVLTKAAQEQMSLVSGRAEMSERIEIIELLVDRPAEFFELRRDLNWLGGSA